ncbi:hypothetical protein IC619_012385 [Hazenella sp. IB182353]|uniref:hypothetical protein n=1 Tax=Polycladospora coralii TaxID=2771432 RepID=UPI0017465153|nr:hypothetical protein [Polycladospora coralii]MBS7531290.1 hypothetical protein [Polycladospora coralii]
MMKKLLVVTTLAFGMLFSTTLATPVEAASQSNVEQIGEYTVYTYAKSEYPTMSSIPNQIDTRPPGTIGIPHVLYLNFTLDLGDEWVAFYVSTY